MKTFFNLCAFLLVLILIQPFCVYKNPDVSVARICTCLSAKEKKKSMLIFSLIFSENLLRFFHGTLTVIPEILLWLYSIFESKRIGGNLNGSQLRSSKLSNYIPVHFYEIIDRDNKAICGCFCLYPGFVTEILNSTKQIISTGCIVKS